tara:strand:+ start:20139 stop:23453 length:3315 start_codon:yes stop_codon:yes gene_type:complete
MIMIIKNKLKKFLKLNLTFIVFIFLLVTFNGGIHANQANDLQKKQLDIDFISPPETIQTSVYWYWISDNISKEGVVRDLKSMKAAGINRAFIGNIGLDDVPYGNVKMLSDEWWEIIHEALKTATKLNIEIGIFNSPGWSQSGGPWVKAENSMRYLISSETRISGPIKLSKTLKKPHEIFQDVRVVAYPAPDNGNDVLNISNSNIDSKSKLLNISKAFDGNLKTGFTFPSEGKFIIDIRANEFFTARSLSISSIEVPMMANIQFQARNNDGIFQTIKVFEMDRSHSDIKVGFVPWAPVVISFPKVISKDFRLIIDYQNKQNEWVYPLNKKLSGISEITISGTPRVERYAEKTLAKMFSSPLPYWDEYQWDQQAIVDNKRLVVDPLKVVDISKFLSSDGILNWDVPDGDWIIQRSGMTPTGIKNGPASPEATGYEVDKMSKKHVETHFYGHIGELLERIPKEDRKSFKVVVLDSYEKGAQNFTDGFLEEFKKTYDYDPLPFLPVYQGTVVDSQKASDRFLWDMRRLVANKIAYDYVGGLREVSHNHNLTTWLENYGHWGFPGEFLMYGGQTDELSGEFWSEGTLGDVENRAASSAGHIYGKSKISAESNTSASKSFYRYPGIIKKRSDRFFAVGINNTLLHVYITQPYEDKSPGMNAWFGTEFNRKNTWFSQIDVYIEYLKRTNFLLQQGLNVADIAYFIGEDTPKMTGVTDPSVPIGYQFDYMNAEVILKYMSVKDGLITLPHGTQYKIMVLPKLKTMRPEILKKINQLVNEGAVILGPPPNSSPSLQNQPQADIEIKHLAEELWGEVDGVKIKSRKVGKGLIINGMDMKEAFALIDVAPDVKLPEDNSIHYAHRSFNGHEIYFLTNQTNQIQTITPEFRVSNLQPELWLATTGERRILPAFEIKRNTTAVPLKLEPYESVFLVFRSLTDNPKLNDINQNYPKPEIIQNINKNWLVTFDPEYRGPENSVIFPELIDWTISDDDKIKYYSGTAFYKNTFTIPNLKENEKITIDIGNFTAMAKVRINGQYAGGLWTPPHQLNVSDLVKEGENEIEIEIVNTWVNRIIGDMQLPKKDRQIWTVVNPYNANSPLQSSGLFGPVSINRIR